MRLRHLLATALLVGGAGCVSILGVDADEVEDLDETICQCAKSGVGACEEIAQTLLQQDGAEEKARECVAASDTCDALDACLGESVCIAEGKRCAARDDASFQLRCCGELRCVDELCLPGCGDGLLCGTSCCTAGQICDEQGARPRCVDCSGRDEECGVGTPCCSGDCIAGVCVPIPG